MDIKDIFTEEELETIASEVVDEIFSDLEKTANPALIAGALRALPALLGRIGARTGATAALGAAKSNMGTALTAATTGFSRGMAQNQGLLASAGRGLKGAYMAAPGTTLAAGGTAAYAGSSMLGDKPQQPVQVNVGYPQQMMRTASVNDPDSLEVFADMLSQQFSPQISDSLPEKTAQSRSDAFMQMIYEGFSHSAEANEGQNTALCAICDEMQDKDVADAKNLAKLAYDNRQRGPKKSNFIENHPLLTAGLGGLALGLGGSKAKGYVDDALRTRKLNNATEAFRQDLGQHASDTLKFHEDRLDTELLSKLQGIQDPDVRDAYFNLIKDYRKTTNEVGKKMGGLSDAERTSLNEDFKNQLDLFYGKHQDFPPEAIDYLHTVVDKDIRLPRNYNR